MKSAFSFRSLVGVTAGFFYILNILLVGAIIFLLFPLGKMIPNEHVQKRCLLLIHHCISRWADINRMIMSLMTNTKIEAEGVEGLDVNEWYLVTANHRSWVDTCVLYEVFNHKIPSLRFLAKQELLWLPFIGQSCLLLGVPFLKRGGKKTRRKQAESTNKDSSAAGKVGEGFNSAPSAIVTFVEGTRYSPEKAKKQNSPYQHLLKPRAGGMAFVLAALSDHIHYYLDVTIIYPDGLYSLWDFFCGRIRRILVEVEKRSVTSDFVGDYRNDPVFRERFQARLNHIWEEKDQLIDKTLAENKG